MLKPQGIIASLVTPMGISERINENALRSHVSRMIGAGVHGLLCLGTYGEFYVLSHEEKLEVIRIVVDETRGRVPVYAGTGCISTEETIALTKKAKQIGVDAVSIITPYFIRISQDELYNHYRMIASSVDIPIVLCNVPARTGINLDYQTVDKLSLLPNIIGIEDCGDFNNKLNYLENSAGHLTVLSGCDSAILWTLMAGGTGCISGIANLFPEKIVKIYQLWYKANIDEAKIVEESLRPFIKVMNDLNPDAVVKRAINLLGYFVGPTRGPVSENSRRQDEIILEAVKVCMD